MTTGLNSYSRKCLCLRALLSLFVLCGLLCATSQAQAQASRAWPVAKANDWQQKHGWLVGCNFSPAYAINQLEMWQPETFDLKAIDHELDLAEGLGFNSVRVFLHDLLWQQDERGFLNRMDKFLAAADKHHIGVMFVLLDACWNPFPKIGKQPEPRPHVHNSGWVQSPGQTILSAPARYEELKPYITGVLRRFRNDRRVHAWDLFNEPDNDTGAAYKNIEITDKPQKALALLQKVVGWARDVKPSQPLTIDVWYGEWGVGAKLNPMQKFSLDNSDVISFHSYGSADELIKRIAELRHYNRPILCTEYMARPQGSAFDPHLALMKAQRVAAYNWGFVSGKTQTIYPWDSWTRTYTEEPPVWFHDIFRPDGSPYRPEEVTYIRRTTGKAETP